MDQAGWSALVRSCPIGTMERPCWSCEKCFRKEIVNAAYAKREPEPLLLDALSTDQAELFDIFSDTSPRSFHHLFEYAFSRLPMLRATPLRDVMNTMRLDIDATRWVERHYRPALENDVPREWLDAVRPGVLSNTTAMDEDDQSNFVNWDASTLGTTVSDR